MFPSGIAYHFRLHQFKLSAGIKACRLRALLEQVLVFIKLRFEMAKQMSLKLLLAYVPMLPVLVIVLLKCFVALVIIIVLHLLDEALSVAIKLRMKSD